MTDVYYVTSFRKLAISPSICGHFELLPGVNITNDRTVISRLLTPDLKVAAGVVEMEHLESSPNIVFGEFHVDDMRGLEPGKFLLAILIWIDTLFKNAWLVRDHAMECDAAFLRVARSSESVWCSNFLASRSSLSSGDFDAVIDMSLEELQAWRKKHDAVESYLHEKDSSPVRFMMEKGYARSGRAMQFVHSARKTADVAFKIANYCSALETLFTTESTELAHKLSERLAFFLSQLGQDRLNVFTTIKSAYTVRSKLVHGDTLKASQIEELPSLSMRCDNYLRLVLNAIFESPPLQNVFDSHNQAIEEYFTGLIFGRGNSGVE
jgi:hypothetical protein